MDKCGKTPAIRDTGFTQHFLPVINVRFKEQIHLERAYATKTSRALE